jgi:hypothetical protein
MFAHYQSVTLALQADLKNIAGRSGAYKQKPSVFQPLKRACAQMVYLTKIAADLKPKSDHGKSIWANRPNR